MTNKTIDGVPRELLEKALRDANTIRFSTDSHVEELRTLLAAPVVERQPEQQVACMPVERCYDVRAKMIIAFNEARKTGGDLDDGLDAAYKSALRYSPNPLLASPPAPASQYTLTAEQFEAIEALLKENPASQNVALQDLLARKGRWDAPVDAAKAFAKGFNTLETVDGKYKIVMQFSGRDDAWSAYTALSKMTASLAKPQ